MVDKNLFLYDLAVVTIMKNEEPYVKEWIDYHLLAGVDHFYIYDNESTPKFKKILQPYIDAGIVTYTFYPGKPRQMESYLDAVKNYKFFCRYMAFIDGDEFIFPKSKSTITEVVDEILSPNPNAAGLCINWRYFGSNNLEKADYTRGVLERFTACQEGVAPTIKTILDPRKAKVFHTPHNAVYFDGCYSVNENGNFVPAYSNDAQTGNKIVMHHYRTKSREEWEVKTNRGRADLIQNVYLEQKFNLSLHNDVQDDGILKYQKARRDALVPKGGGIENLFQSKQIQYPKIINALMKNLSPVIQENPPQDFFTGKMENFFICLNLSEYLKKNYFGDDKVNLFEELSLNAIHRVLYTGLVIPDLLLLIGEMPKILRMKYPVVEKIREFLIHVIPQMMTSYRMYNRWQEFVELDYKLDMLKSFKV